MKVPNPQGNGKDIAEDKSVHREVESEGRRKWERQTTENLCPDEQNPHIRSHMRVRMHAKSKPNNYTESCGMDVAGGLEEKKCVVPG